MASDAQIQKNAEYVNSVYEKYGTQNTYIGQSDKVAASDRLEGYQYLDVYVGGEYRYSFMLYYGPEPNLIPPKERNAVVNNNPGKTGNKGSVGDTSGGGGSIGGGGGGMHGNNGGTFTGSNSGLDGMNTGTVPEPQHLQVTSSTENKTIPVIFGQQVVVGNVLRYDNNSFEAHASAESADVAGTGTYNPNLGAGLGGGSAVTYASEGVDPRVYGSVDEKTQSFDYYLTFDLGICCGPIDAIADIFVTPGKQSCTAEILDFSGAARLAVNLDDKDGFSGLCYVYNGSMTQTRFGSDGYAAGIGNRGVALAHFKNFKLGKSPSIKTLNFECIRYPKCKNANGDTLANFPTRGSNDTEHASYTDANPAACMWEILTNKDWGAAISPEWLDEDAFRTAAHYFAANNIGVSFTLGSPSQLGEIINTLTALCGAVMVWNGAILKIVVLTDLATAYAKRVRLTEREVSEPVLSRGSWTATYNEIRLSYINRGKGYVAETVHLQDMASVAVIGRIQTLQMEGLGLASREAAEKIGRRLLKDVAYPRGTLRFSMTRFASGIEPGTLIEYVSEAWGAPFTTFWRVGSITDSPRSQLIEVNCMEDSYAVGFLGTDSVFDEPEPYPTSEIRDPSEIELGDDANAEAYGGFGPAMVFEPPAVFTRGKAKAVLGIQRKDGVTVLTLPTWDIESGGVPAGAPTNLPICSPWAILGTLSGPVATGPRWQPDFTLDMALEWPANAATVLNACAYVENFGEDFSTATRGPYALLFVGKEIIKCGWAIETAPGSGVIRFSNVIRGELGTDVQAHLDGAQCMFIPMLTTGHIIDVSEIPTRQDILFSADQRTNRGTIVPDTEIAFYGPSTKQFTGRNRKPPAPLLVAPITGTTTKTAYVRASLTTRGAGTHATLEEDCADIMSTIPAGMAFCMVGYEADGTTVHYNGNVASVYSSGALFGSLPNGAPAALNWTQLAFVPESGYPGSGNNRYADTGRFQLTFTPSGPTIVKLYMVENGVMGAEGLQLYP